ncbi:MAG TPA: hypothetical protein VMT18_07170 [Planctomycetota bacterium]|nr:hypothetical protein [Planctomycetota bacterium]
MSTPKKPDPHPVAAHAHDDEEVVHVPKGQSKLRFLLTLGLMLFVLVIFTVGDQFMGTFGGGRGQSATAPYMTWQHPTEGAQALTWAEYVGAKRSIDDFFRVQGQNPGRDQTDDENITYLLITDRLARDAGMEVATAEIGRILREGQRGLCTPFLNEQNYRAALARWSVTPASFEATLAWLLRVQRYEGLTLFALATPAPSAVEQAWKEQHAEYAFEVVRLARADQRDAAALEEPDEVALAAWYEGLEAAEKGRLFRDAFTPERTSAELLSWAPGTALPEGLLERYPAPEGTDPEVAGRNYYDLYQHVRFRRPEPAEGEAPAEGESRDQLYLPYDEVAAEAAEQSRVRAALEALLADLRARRAAGEELDLAALAGELGLQLLGDGLPRSREAWREAVDPEVVIHLSIPGEGKLLRAPVVGSSRLWIGQVLETLPSAPPPLAEVQTQAREAWLDQRAGELARERLEAVYDALVAEAGETPAEGAEVPDVVGATDEGFAAALSVAGLTASAIDWFDPARAAEARGEEDQDPALAFLLDNYFPGAPRFALEEGQVAAPRASRDGETLWLVRGAGRREPSEVRMRPAEYQMLRQQARYEGLSRVYESTSNPAAVAERYGVAYPGRLESDEDDS